MSKRPPKVLIAKPGLDGHDRGAKIIARGLRDAGMEVIYTGLRQTPEMIAESALQEDVDIVGLSILSGSHMTLVPAVRDAMDEAEIRDIPIIVGGIIPNQDKAELLTHGVVYAVFGPGASLVDIIKEIYEITQAKDDAE